MLAVPAWVVGARMRRSSVLQSSVRNEGERILAGWRFCETPAAARPLMVRKRQERCSHDTAAHGQSACSSHFLYIQYLAQISIVCFLAVNLWTCMVIRCTQHIILS